MNPFFRNFFASLLALVVFSLIGFFLLLGVIGALASKEKPEVPEKSVLMLDLSQHFNERVQENPLGLLTDGEGDVPGLYDVLRLIRSARNDKNIAGIYILANENNNGFAASEELRQALLDFKTSRKFILAHGNTMSQKAFFVAQAADRIYGNPVGMMEWNGFSANLLFLKGTLEKLNIQPQIFYAGKFKSATEPLRTDKMTPENKLQTGEWLGDLYRYFLVQSAQARKKDTAALHQLANTGTVQTTQDAVQAGLMDAVKYDDEVRDEIKKKLGKGKHDKFSLVSISKYAEAADYRRTGSDRIALIYAEGDIVDGEGSRDNIGGEHFRKLVRKARLDRSTKAIVLRINSGGGSALASEIIWRELAEAKRDKPVVVSFGDVAASGGYYIGCGADSIFALPNTITGSIGVFGVIPNMQGFFNDKLGVTFDGVKTAPYADAGAVYRPLNETEKQIYQQQVDRIYLQFKQRVAQGRKKDIALVDSIAQGRVWSGEDALALGLVDKIGGLQAAIDCAARLAKTKDYRLREYPERENWLNTILGKSTPNPEVVIKERLGEENYLIYRQLLHVQQLCGTVQARMPYQILFN